MNKLLISALLTSLLAACGSSPTTTSDAAKGTPGTSTTTVVPSTDTKSNVTPVVVAPPTTDGLGPQSFAKVVYFDYDSYVIKPEAIQSIEAHARYLKANTTRKLKIAGHADERGGSEYNLALGQKRAEVVRKSLTLLGASDAQMEAVSFGKEKPAVVGNDESAYSKNRRAELSYQ